MLTDLQCRTAKARESAYKMTDEKGLYLFVTTTGFRSWRWKYRFANKEKRLTFGGYPEISLARARELRDEARRLARGGTDPGIVRKQRAAELALATDTTFRSLAEAWHTARKKAWKPRYACQIEQRLTKHVYPTIGAIPADDITSALVLKVIRSIEAREAHEIAHRVRQYVSDIFVFGIASGLCKADPASVVRKALIAPTRRLRPAVTNKRAAQRVLQRSESTTAYLGTKLAARLLALTAARPGVVRLAEPDEFEGLDTAAPIWRIPAAKMKLTRERRIDTTYEFVIPLAPQAVEIVKLALDFADPRGPLFPSVWDRRKPISINTLSKFYRDAGLQGVHCPHGWRATFSTIMNEKAADDETPEDRAIIDMMLAHIANGVEPAYNRAAYMRRRRAIAVAWADLLLKGHPSVESLVDGCRGSSPRSERRRNHDRRLTSAGSPQADEEFRRKA